MRFSKVFVASSVASFVAAHGSIQGAPKLFGLPDDIKIRMPSPRAARAAAAMEGPRHLQTRQGGDANNRCGPSFGNAVCAAGYCCSGAGYCGQTKDHCNAPDCLFDFGPGCDANKTPAGVSTRNDARPQKGSVAYGGAGIYACRKAGTVAITYDDGPYIYTDQVLDKFAAAGFKATFFVTGINLGKGAIDEQWSGAIKRMVAEGHQVASHTWSHQDLSAITEAQVYDQMVKNEMAIRNIIGKYPTYMRPPYSSCNPACENILQRLGYVVSYFDLDTDDYNQLTPIKIETAKNNFRNAVNGANPSSQSKLAIAHDIHELTALNLTVTMIETLQARGFKGVTMGECMNEPEANWYRDSAPATPGSPTTSTSTVPTSTPTGTVSADGTCGGDSGFICIGFVHEGVSAPCCSRYNYCGATIDHCGTGCNPLFGNCGTNANPSSGSTSVSSSMSSSVTLSSPAPVPSKDKLDSTSSSAALTPSVTSTAVHSSSATSSVSIDESGKKSSTISSVQFDSTSTAASENHESSTVSSTYYFSTSSAFMSKHEEHSSTVSSVSPDVTSSASNKHESTTASSIYPSDSLPSSVPTKPSQTSSVYTDDFPTAKSSSAVSSTGKHSAESTSTVYPVASSTGDSMASSSTVDHPATSSAERSTTFVSSVKPATSTPCTTLSTPTPTPTKPVSQDGKCGGENGQTCAGYKNSFGLKLECCRKTSGRCSADPWTCTAGCDKKNGKCWY